VTGTLHDRDGLPDPDERPTGEMAVPDTDDTPYTVRQPSPADRAAPRSGAILAYGCLALLLAAGVVVWAVWR
jgi:hypothetical protein